MNAELLQRDRFVFDDGAVVEMAIWRVADPVPGSAHRFKYRLYYGRAGKRLVSYDNERGKGDHRHLRRREETYAFTTVDTLIRDFLADAELRRFK